MGRSTSVLGVGTFTLLGGLLLGGACSTEFNPQTCETDTDCGTGLVCEVRDSEPVCVAAAEAPIRVGQSAPITGTNQQLGTQMKLGIELAFDEVNDAGGVRGRMLELEFLDDAYVPENAYNNARTLTDVQEGTEAPRCPSTAMPPVATDPPASMVQLDRGPNSVLAILGAVGTPTMARAAPVAIETGTLYFGAFTGAGTLLRDTKGGDCAKYIFNVRGSYAQEARATLEYFNKKKGVATYTHLISFDQNDSFGQAGYDGLKKAYEDLMLMPPLPVVADNNPIARFRYVRNMDSSVPDQATAAQAYLATLLADGNSHVVGVMMTDTYGAGSTFIQLMRQWQYSAEPQRSKLQLHFSNVSFVGPNALVARLLELGTYTTPQGPKSFTTDVVVSQVVPNYDGDTSEVVMDYMRLIGEKGASPGFTSLEGYIAGRIFGAGLLAHQGPFTPDALISTFENLPSLSLGLGASAGFTPSNHQYSQSVWGTILQADGKFKNLYFWSSGQTIQFFE